MIYSRCSFAGSTLWEFAMSISTLPLIGATLTCVKVVSEADIALFFLITDDRQLQADEPPNANENVRVPVPPALVAALLAGAAARLAGDAQPAAIERADVRCLAIAQPDDTLTVVAEVTAFDGEARRITARARCADQHGRQLAEGDFELRAAD
jgi:acyl dehydratase